MISKPFLVLYFCFALAACEPQAPTWYNTKTEKTTMNQIEGSTAIQTTLLDNAGGRKYVNTSTDWGWYASLTLPNSSYIMWPFNSSVFCAGGPATNPPNYPPIKFAFPFTSKFTVRGHLANAFVFSAGRYKVEFLISEATGAPMVMTGLTIGGTLADFQVFQNNTNFSFDQPEFQVPSYCSTLPSAQVRRDNPYHGFTPQEAINSLSKHVTILGGEFKPTMSVLPLSVDNRPFATPIRSQGDCGGCWAFATMGATEIAYYISKQVVNPGTSGWFSTQYLIDCTHGDLNGTALIPARGCQGAWPTIGLDLIVKHGTAANIDYPFREVTGMSCHFPTNVIFPLSGSQYIHGDPANNTELIQDAVATYGAVIVIINVPKSFIYFESGIYNDNTCTPGLAHAVTIVGYGTDGETGLDYWIVRNSWGPSWCEGGYIRVVRGVNMCGIEQFGMVPIPA